MTLFFAFLAHAKETPKKLTISNFDGVQIQFSQSLSFELGKYAEDSKARVSKGEVIYVVSYDTVIKSKDEVNSPFCKLSVVKTIRHKTHDYAQASNEILEILQQKKTILFEAKEIFSIKEALIENDSIQLKIDSKKESNIIAECITPGFKEDEDKQILLENVLKTFHNSQAKLTKNGKEFPPAQHNPDAKPTQRKGSKS